MRVSDQDAMDLIGRLPQSRHIKPESIKQFLSRVSKDNTHTLAWHIGRLMGVGGSESAAILNFYYKSAVEIGVNINADFKDAAHISCEKLLLKSPFSTPQAIRGNRIEGMIRDIVEHKYKLTAENRDYKSMTACQRHATNQYMVGNPDDIFLLPNKIRILFDYKSTVLKYSEAPYSNIVQINHYAENARSHGIKIDICALPYLEASEEVFNDLIRLYEEREHNRSDYDYFVNAIANDKFSFVKLNVMPVTASPEMGDLINKTISRFFNDYPLSGKVISKDLPETILVEDQIERAKKIQTGIFHILSAERAVETLKSAFIQNVEKFKNEVGGEFEWPGDKPVNIQSKRTYDYEAAISVLIENGLNRNSLLKKSNSLNEEAIRELLLKNNIPLTDDLYESGYDKEKVISGLSSMGIPISAFEVKTETTVGFSRNYSDKDALYANQINIQERIFEVVSQETELDMLNIENNHVMN